MAKTIKLSLDENSKTLLMVAAVALITLIISSQIVRSRFKEAERLRLKGIEESMKLSARVGIAKIERLNEEYARYLYPKSGISTLRDTISLLAREAEADIVSVQPLAQGKVGSFAKTSFKIKLKCTYDQLGKFIASIESMPNLIRVEELTIYGGDVSEAANIAARGSLKEVSIDKKKIADVSVVLTAYTYEA